MVINEQEVPWTKTNARVSQGSILGPLLFLEFINDVVNDIGSDRNLLRDDTSLMKIVDQVVAAYTTINKDLIKLSR